MALIRQQSDKAPPKGFNQYLFETGMFSDVTLTFGENHSFKAHSAIISQKSSWLAGKCGGPTIANRTIRNNDPAHPKCNLSKEHTDSTSCSIRDEHSDATCGLWACFLVILQFCYTGEYTLEVSSGRVLCAFHIQTYRLGKLYLVHDILPHAVAAFVSHIENIQKTNLGAAIPLVNIVYTLFSTDKDDALVAEARKIAERIADSMDIGNVRNILQDATNARIKEMMPKAGADLLQRGYKRKLPSFTLPASEAVESVFPKDDAKTCFRCRNATTVNGTRLCGKCTTMPILEPNMNEGPRQQLKAGEFWRPSASKESPFQAGITCTFWACLGCDRIWQGQELRRSDIRMKECPGCDPLNIFRYERDRSHVGPVSWKCRGCLTVWVAYIYERKKMSDMDRCICCPEKRE